MGRPRIDPTAEDRAGSAVVRVERTRVRRGIDPNANPLTTHTPAWARIRPIRRAADRPASVARRAPTTAIDTRSTTAAAPSREDRVGGSGASHNPAGYRPSSRAHTSTAAPTSGERCLLGRAGRTPGGA